jgi:1,4-alpha-glucan branching enzyme
VQAALRDLNRLYAGVPALHELDFSPEGFAWIDCNDVDQSVLSYCRFARDGSYVIVLLNFTPVPRTGFRVGVRHKGCYREIFNSDSHYYGGSNTGNGLGLNTSDIGWNGEQQSLELTLPPLAGIVLQRVS